MNCNVIIRVHVLGIVLEFFCISDNLQAVVVEMVS